ncbi:MAG: archease [Lysobacterales bacterium]|jgi:SHS2 domain-containing protein
MGFADPKFQPGKRWEHFEHVADIGVRGFGKTRAEAFEHAALALTAVVCDPARIKPARNIAIHCEAPDTEILLTDWLNAIIFEMATRNMLFSRFEVRLDGNRLTATASGEAVHIEKHRPATEIKGATLSELRVSQDATGHWLAQCILDV